MATLLKQWDFGLSDVRMETLHAVRDGKEEEVLVPFGIHNDGEREMKLPMFAESSGTQAAFVLLAGLLPILAEGGTVLFDELEADLHPLMLEPILNLFISHKSNPHHAQLIFTCHSMETLNLLKKGQIMLVEKMNAAAAKLGVFPTWKACVPTTTSMPSTWRAPMALCPCCEVQIWPNAHCAKPIPPC